MAAAEAATPDASTKAEVWERLHGSGYPSLRLALAAAGGFWRRSQRDICDPFVPRFFDGVAELYTSWEQEAAKNYFTAFFPSHRVDEPMIEMVGAVLEDDSIGPMLRRQLVEARDDLERALRCRAFAAAG